MAYTRIGTESGDKVVEDNGLLEIETQAGEKLVFTK